MQVTTNRLAKETSPYLLQHAHNPVDWYPWGEEAFAKAREENKPVLVSIGYSACHWCHVMERESFEDPEVAAIMNDHFVNIKVDREERPDVDHLYMDALQAMSGSGGWPLNVFLTPDKKPFYGGTYFPPRRAYNRASWTEILNYLSKAWEERREEVQQQAENLTEHLKVSNVFGQVSEPVSNDRAGIKEAVDNLMKNADREWGGFGRAPKFPQTFTLQFLMQYAHITGDGESLDQALLSLDKMLQGGIYDQIGGGFARYSTDTEWLAPHFEKMLYDNALLVIALADAFQLTGDATYQEAIAGTLAFTERELMHPEGVFYSALDADSEGVEGKYYVWDREEVMELLGEKEGELICSFYDITLQGNWEGKNIPRILQPMGQFAEEKGLDLNELKRSIAKAKAQLMERRSQRVRPQLDDKSLLGWNALMNQAYTRAYSATGDPHYLEIAEKNLDFLLKAYRTEDGLLFHTWKQGTARQPAFLDDYAYLVAALIEMAQATGRLELFDRAAELTVIVEAGFSDPASPYFFYTHERQEDIIVRKKEVYDGATPSGNAVMAFNLHRLSIIFDRNDWRERGEAMARGLADAVFRYPSSFAVWLSLIFELQCGTAEIVILGDKWKIYLEKIRRMYISHKLALATENPLPGYPLLADKAKNSNILIYVCKNYSCRQPVNTIQDFIPLIQSK